MHARALTLSGRGTVWCFEVSFEVLLLHKIIFFQFGIKSSQLLHCIISSDNNLRAVRTSILRQQAAPVVCGSLYLSKLVFCRVCSRRCSGSGPCLALALPAFRPIRCPLSWRPCRTHTAHPSVSHQSGQGSAVLSVVLGCVHVFVCSVVFEIGTHDVALAPSNRGASLRSGLTPPWGMCPNSHVSVRKNSFLTTELL